jgi:mannosyltransferase OCH1-like enzyme
MRIPRIFHQIWVGPNPFPDEFAAYRRTWLELNPGWQLRFWTDETLPPREELRRPEAADRLRVPVERADILRLEVLWREGGVHVDADFECRKPIEPLIEDAELFVGVRKPGRLNGALMGSVPRHPLLERGLAELEPQHAYGLYLKEATGPRFLDRLLLDQPGVTFVSPEHFYPRTPEQLDDAYAVHHKARSWKDADSMRRLLEKAERRVVEEQREARKWRERYEQATAELELLREGVKGG